MNPRLQGILSEASRVISMHGDGPVGAHNGVLHVGVDLGTAYTVLVVLNEDMIPVAGACRFAEVVRDGVVLDFLGAIQLVTELKRDVERRMGVELRSASSAYPPGVPLAEVRATGNVLEGAGLRCSKLLDEATAASALLQVEQGAVVDAGGGTTKLAVIRQGKVLYVADEPTGGTHMSLVIAGALKIPFMEAEERKKDPAEQPALFSLVRPVMEKMATIVARHIEGYQVNTIYLVGGAARFPGFSEVIEEVTGVKTVIPGDPLFVTPIGIAMHN